MSLLNDLIAHANRFTVDGVEVVLARTMASQYVADFAVLAHKFMDMENLQVLFALAQMEDRVYVVGRSRLPEVNVGEILAEMGGGGHEFAASAAIKDKPLAQVEEDLKQILNRRVRPLRRAKDVMSFPVKWVSPEVSLEGAELVLNRYSINALPVVDNARLLGLISRQIVEKGIFHGLKDHPVKDYMSTPVATVGPDDTLAEIRDKLVVNKQRLLPVLQEGEVVGIISRTDLLNLLIDIGEETEESQWSQPLRKKSILSLMRERLPKPILSILAQAGQVAKELRVPGLRGGGVCPGPVHQAG